MRNISQTINETKIGFWTPYLHSQRGNSITARRIVEGLRKLGFTVEVFAYDEEEWDRAVQEKMESCDLFHILHFNRFSKWREQQKVCIERPYIVTSGGTDVNEKMDHPISKDLLLNASFITVFTAGAAEKVIETYPELRDRVEVVPQSVWVPERKEALYLELPDGRPRILLPSGIRKVKDVFYVMDVVESLTNDYPDLEFVIAGEPLEQKETEQVRNFEKKHPWFTYIGSVPFASMADLYEWADVVINTSISEGQPIALMEALYHGKPVIARKNAGNESLIDHGNNGFIFENPTQFKRQFLQMINDGNLYEQLSKKGRERMLNEFSHEKEMQQYQAIYQSIRGVQL
ncbi:glycosyltransferase family 4 protein [Bacillus sp. Marseille-Q3570]|uniref:glycosyltransferase family 4 protein n=1 Tax=Bacillus sp. Marseille-Q3570 TaxID=2963522 RepID=UPI0021B7BC3B|nr:glycosyltransferase family 4 protein [Bacillus sp. Marseille-Q3570]